MQARGRAPSKLEGMGSSWGRLPFHLALSALSMVLCTESPFNRNWIPGNRSAFSVFPFRQHLLFHLGLLGKSFPGRVLQTQGNKITPGKGVTQREPRREYLKNIVVRA